MSYTYGTSVYNGITLHMIRTQASNILLRNTGTKNVVDTGHYGMNGGFFGDTSVASITVNNDISVGTMKYQDKSYGSGWANISYSRGTMVYDGATGNVRIVVTDSAGNITVTDRSKYWAQGGVSMSLQSDSTWQNIALNQQALPRPNVAIQRAGLVYNSNNEVWLIITAANEPGATAQQFRDAIKAKVSVGSLVDGIFLDGSGSAQMSCAEYSHRGDGRTVLTMVGLQVA